MHLETSENWAQRQRATSSSYSYRKHSYFQRNGAKAGGTKKEEIHSLNSLLPSNLLLVDAIGQTQQIVIE